MYGARHGNLHWMNWSGSIVYTISFHTIYAVILKIKDRELGVAIQSYIVVKKTLIPKTEFSKSG